MIIMNKKITFVSLESRMATENGRRSRQNWNLKQLSIHYLCHSVSQSLSQAFKYSILQLLRHSGTLVIQLLSHFIQSPSYSITQLLSHSITQSLSHSVSQSIISVTFFWQIQFNSLPYWVSSLRSSLLIVHLNTIFFAHLLPLFGTS